MSQALIDELGKENLCTHFVLPLLKINKFSFITSNFVNSYLYPEGTGIIVKVFNTDLLSRKLFVHPMFVETVEISPYTYLLYRIPDYWHQDVRLFMEGKFSLMSDRAKDTIVRYSGLPYRERNGKGKRAVTDGRLLALEKHEVLKDMWERVLNLNEDAHRWIQNAELLNVPGKDSYMDPLSLLHAKNPA